MLFLNEHREWPVLSYTTNTLRSPFISVSIHYDAHNPCVLECVVHKHCRAWLQWSVVLDFNIYSTQCVAVHCNAFPHNATHCTVIKCMPESLYPNTHQCSAHMALQMALQLGISTMHRCEAYQILSSNARGSEYGLGHPRKNLGRCIGTWRCRDGMLLLALDPAWTPNLGHTGPGPWSITMELRPRRPHLRVSPPWWEKPGFYLYFRIMNRKVFFNRYCKNQSYVQNASTLRCKLFKLGSKIQPLRAQSKVDDPVY